MCPSEHTRQQEKSSCQGIAQVCYRLQGFCSPEKGMITDRPPPFRDPILTAQLLRGERSESGLALYTLLLRKGLPLLAGYAFFLFGANLYTRGANCFWGWPLMAWSSGAGFLGLLTSAYSLASSLLNVSHVSIVLSFGAAALPGRLLGWQSNLWLRLASFVWTATYLYFFGSLAPLPRELCTCKLILL